MAEYRTELFQTIAPLVIESFCGIKQSIVDCFKHIQTEINNANYTGLFGADDLCEIPNFTTGKNGQNLFNFLGDFKTVAIDGYPDFSYSSTSPGLSSEHWPDAAETLADDVMDFAEFRGKLQGFLTETAGQYIMPFTGISECADLIPNIKAKGLFRIRQLMTQVEMNPAWDDYYQIQDYEIDAHMEECEICMEDPDSCPDLQAIYDRADAIVEEIYAPLFAEFPLGSKVDSMMYDPYTDGTKPTGRFSNPLMVVGVTNLCGMYNQSGGSDNIPAITLLRTKYLTGTQCYDNGEKTFSSGNPNWTLSNYFSWLNQPKSASKAWKVPTHSEDTFSESAPPFGYLACCDTVLLRNACAFRESQRKILSKSQLASGSNSTYYAPAFATLLTARAYGLPSGSNCGTHPLAFSPNYSEGTSGDYFKDNQASKRKFDVAPVGTQAKFLNLITKSPLKMTTSSSAPYGQLMGAIDTSGNFTGGSLTSYTAIQPAHVLVGFHLDKLLGLDPKYLKGVTLT